MASFTLIPSSYNSPTVDRNNYERFFDDFGKTAKTGEKNLKAWTDQSLRPLLIAHAGGGLDGRTATNSREALDENYRRGHRYFEIDLSWTSDGHLVLLHDWKEVFTKWFGLEPKPVSLKRFKALKMKLSLHQMTLDDLYVWLSKHEDAFIITDAKDRNLSAMEKIAGTAGPLKNRFIPQIYGLDEYAPIMDLGFTETILTLYRTKITDEEILRFAANNRIYAVTLSLRRAFSSSLSEELKKRGVFVYAHTVNESAVWEYLRSMGVYGVYTNLLTLEDLGQKTD
jgi:glycerophosphoryl diester phosphodiesterase